MKRKPIIPEHSQCYAQCRLPSAACSFWWSSIAAADGHRLKEVSRGGVLVWLGRAIEGGKARAPLRIATERGKTGAASLVDCEGHCPRSRSSSAQSTSLSFEPRASFGCGFVGVIFHRLKVEAAMLACLHRSPIVTPSAEARVSISAMTACWLVIMQHVILAQLLIVNSNLAK